MDRGRWAAWGSAAGYGLAGMLTAALGVVAWIGCFATPPGVVCHTLGIDRIIAAFVPFVIAGALFAGGIAIGRMARAAEPVHLDGPEESPWRGP